MMTGVPAGSVRPPYPVYRSYTMDFPAAPRAEAGPLPAKRGEIGFVEGVHTQLEPRLPPAAITLPARHPADRDIALEAQIPSANSIVPITPRPISAPAGQDRDLEAGDATSAKQNSYAAKIDGLHLTTLSFCAFQFTFLGATIAGWVLSIRSLKPDTATGLALGGPTLAVSLHVIFAIILLVQLVFLERTIFRLRIQRYAHLHPGEDIPSRIRAAVPTPALALAPWNRPPLPTYAAALAQSGQGTGDVEDHLIAAPPPPAYGNTRGSTLVLAGFMRESLLAQRPVSTFSAQSADNAYSERPASVQSNTSGLSYVNQLPEGEPGPENYEDFVNGLLSGRIVHGGDETASVVLDEAERERRRRRTLAVLETGSRPSSSAH